MTSGKTTQATDLGTWDAALDVAFQVLLGWKPTKDPAAAYGVYYADDSLDECMFPNAWAHLRC